MLLNRLAFRPSVAGAFIQQRPMANWDNVTTPGAFYKQFNAHFADGDLPAGKVAEWRKNDGTVLQTQGDNFSFHDSGCVRSVATTMIYQGAKAPGTTDLLKAYGVAGSWNNASWTTISAVVAQDIRAEITISGVNYTLAANNEITRGQFEQKRSGPLNCQWTAWGELRNGTGANAALEGTVWGKLYLTFFSDGTIKANCRIFSSKGNATTAASKAVTFYQLKSYAGAGFVFFSYSTPFTFLCGCFVDCCNTDREPGFTGTQVYKTLVAFPLPVLADPTTTGLYDSGMMWWIKTTPAEIAAMNPTAMAITYTPMTRAEVTTSVAATGASWWIGHMTARALQAMFKQDYPSFRQDRINAMVEGSMTPYWYMDSVSGYPFALNHLDYPNLTRNDTVCWADTTQTGATIVQSGGALSGSEKDDDHAGQWAWYQWLATGEEEWLDQIQGGVVGVAGRYAVGTATFNRDPLVNGKTFWAVGAQVQARAQAWRGRNRGNVAHASPASHPMTQYCKDLNNGSTGLWNYWEARLTAPFAPAGSLTLGINDYGEGGTSGSVTGVNNAGFMHDYWAMQAAMSVRRGQASLANKLMAIHHALWTIGRGSNGCFFAAVAEQFSIGANTTSGLYGPQSTPPYPQTWAEVNCGNITGTKLAIKVSSATIAGSAVLNFLSTSVADGQTITAPGIPAGTTIVSHTPTTITLSANTSGVIAGQLCTLGGGSVITVATKLATAAQSNVLIVNATGIEDGMPFSASGFPGGVTISSHTATTATASRPTTGSGVAPNATVSFFKWNGTVPNFSGTGCPVSGLAPDWPYSRDSAGFPENYQAGAVACAAVGLAGAAAAVTYMAAAEAADPITELRWAVNPQYRIRPPA